MVKNIRYQKYMKVKAIDNFRRDKMFSFFKKLWLKLEEILNQGKFNQQKIELLSTQLEELTRETKDIQREITHNRVRIEDLKKAIDELLKRLDE